MNRRRVWLVLVGVALVGAGLASLGWYRAFHRPDEPVVVAPTPDDTATSRATTEEKMRAIGYVQ